MLGILAVVIPGIVFVSGTTLAPAISAAGLPGRSDRPVRASFLASSGHRIALTVILCGWGVLGGLSLHGFSFLIPLLDTLMWCYFALAAQHATNDNRLPQPTTRTAVPLLSVILALIVSGIMLIGMMAISLAGKDDLKSIERIADKPFSPRPRSFRFAWAKTLIDGLVFAESQAARSSCRGAERSMLL